MRNLRLTVTYDGTHFHGFQRQAGTRRTVQSSLETAWHTLTGEEVRLNGAGRTDAGVHALGQVVNFKTSRANIPDARVPYAMNSVLPDDVRVIACRRVPDAFHARFDAHSKAYVYQILNQPFPSPLLRFHTYFVAQPLDEERMSSAAEFLVGSHDFAAFAGNNGKDGSTVRTVYDCKVLRQGTLISLEIEANGFLYHMVRAIAGTLIMVGKGERSEVWVKDVLTSCDRSRAGPTAPGHGLTLHSVRYPD